MQQEEQQVEGSSSRIRSITGIDISIHREKASKEVEGEKTF